MTEIKIIHRLWNNETSKPKFKIEQRIENGRFKMEKPCEH